MQESTSLLDSLRRNDYYLMTNEHGKEVYDDDGNLLLYQAESGSCLSVPNSEDVRRLYDLPLNTPEVKDTIKRDDFLKTGLVCVPNEATRTVWVGQKTEHSIKATKMLIELFDSPKYQILMKNPNTVKLKVWEKIASELEENGYKIATNTREAGLRAFQKWRNMERTYWKFLKAGSDEGVEDKRRKKPYFFDDLHVVLSKRKKESMLESNNALYGEAENYKHEEDDEDEEVDIGNRPEGELRKRKRISDLYGTDSEAFPRQALSLLTSLVTSPKYDGCLKEDSNKLYPNKTKIWESIYMDMMKAGWKFGASVREGALILSEKWRMVEKTILRKKLCGPRTLYTPALRKAVLMEIEQRKALGPNYSGDPPSPSEFANPNIRRPKGGEIEPEAIEALLKVLGSGHYQNLLFATAGGKRAKIWEKIFEEVQSQGFEIAGATKREKVTRLFQKWRNMKRSFVKYQISKFKGGEVKKPMFCEMMFKIISNEVLNMNNSECDSDDEIKMEDWDEELESEYPPDFLEFNQGDHDYGHPNGTDETVMINPHQLPSNVDIEQKNSRSEAVKLSVQSKPSTSRTSRSHEVLKQIKSLHETSLAMQQQNFARIISLLEVQISQQNRLTTVISEYITSQTNKSNSKNGHRTETSS